MLAGIVVGYGAGALHFFKYLVPLRQGRRERDLFVGTLAEFPVGRSVGVKDNRGQEIAITRLADVRDDPAAGFRALSTKCPHLGCRAYWDTAKQHFRCPCHEGIFDREGRAVSGPPAAEGKDLKTYEVRVDRGTGWVIVRVPEAQSYGA
jgi:cytochrome b6-f complex iron-sulfur subunit